MVDSNTNILAFIQISTMGINHKFELFSVCLITTGIVTKQNNHAINLHSSNQDIHLSTSKQFHV